MTDDIRLLSEALAADPSSTAFLRLGEALRRQGQLELAARVAARGLERHPRMPEAHDLVARIAIDRGDVARARTAWEMQLALAPNDANAQKGLGFLYFQQGALDEAQYYLGAALVADPDDVSLAAALDTVHAAALQARRPPWERMAATADGTHLPASVEAVSRAPAPPFAPPPADARTLFAEILGNAPQTALLLDADGYVVAGQYQTSDGHDLGADIGAQLSGVSDEASRMMRHLGMGAWRQIVFETEAASVAMAPSGTGVLLVAAPRSVPLGYVRRLLERSVSRAHRWLESGT